MKLCFAANADSIHTRRWVSFFVKQGHDVTVVTHSKEKIEGANMIRLPTLFESEIKNPLLLTILKPFFGKLRTGRIFSFGVNLILGLFKAPKIIRNLKPDLVHAHFVSNYGLYAALSGVKPFVLTPWGTDVLVLANKNFLFNRVTKFVLKKADLITSDGDNTIEAVVKLGADPSKIKKIYFGVDTDSFSPSKRDPEYINKITSGKKVTVISLRGLDPIYNVELLVKAIPLALKEYPDLFFIIVGRGSQSDYLKQLAKELNVESNVKFIPFLSDDDLRKILASCDIYVSTSLSDSGLAASTAEAMASGLPVLITETGSSKDWVTDNVNGFIISKDSPFFLAEKIILLAKDEKMRKSFGEKNRSIIKERQDYRGEMTKMENLYLKLISEK